MQLLALLALFGVVTGLVSVSDEAPFHRFLGSVDPLAALLVVGILGTGLLLLSNLRGWFAICSRPGQERFLHAIELAGAFALLAIVVDLHTHYPTDLNVPFPGSLTFYPAIALGAEVLFHVAPLSLLLAMATLVTGGPWSSRVMRASIAVVATIEPTYQVLWLGIGSQHGWWFPAFSWAHIYLINLAGLSLLRKYDFFTTYGFRVAYYAFWHIAWGYLRLKVLS